MKRINIKKLAVTTLVVIMTAGSVISVHAEEPELPPEVAGSYTYLGEGSKTGRQYYKGTDGIIYFWCDNKYMLFTNGESPVSYVAFDPDGNILYSKSQVYEVCTVISDPIPLPDDIRIIEENEYERVEWVLTGYTGLPVSLEGLEGNKVDQFYEKQVTVLKERPSETVTEVQTEAPVEIITEAVTETVTQYVPETTVATPVETQKETVADTVETTTVPETSTEVLTQAPEQTLAEQPTVQQTTVPVEESSTVLPTETVTQAITDSETQRLAETVNETTSEDLAEVTMAATDETDNEKTLETSMILSSTDTKSGAESTTAKSVIKEPATRVETEQMSLGTEENNKGIKASSIVGIIIAIAAMTVAVITVRRKNK